MDEANTILRYDNFLIGDYIIHKEKVGDRCYLGIFSDYSEKLAIATDEICISFKKDAYTLDDTSWARTTYTKNDNGINPSYDLIRPTQEQINERNRRLCCTNNLRSYSVYVRKLSKNMATTKKTITNYIKCAILFLKEEGVYLEFMRFFKNMHGDSNMATLENYIATLLEEGNGDKFIICAFQWPDEKWKKIDEAFIKIWNTHISKNT